MNVSTFGVVVIFIGGAVVLTVAGFLIVETLHPGFREGSFKPAAASLRGGFTLMFVLILALTIGSLASNGPSANGKVSDEATALAQMTRTAQTFSPETRLVLKAAISEYVHAVAEDEFATMTQGESSPVAAAALANLYGVYQGYTPKSNETSAYSSSLSKIDQLTGIRRERLQLSAQGLPTVLRVVLLIGSILFIILAYPTDIKQRGVRLAVVGSLAGFVAFVFALTILLDFPFVGQDATSNQPYKEAALSQYWPSL
jgi:hypothetical protein